MSLAFVIRAIIELLIVSLAFYLGHLHGGKRVLMIFAKLYEDGIVCFSDSAMEKYRRKKEQQNA